MYDILVERWPGAAPDPRAARPTRAQQRTTGTSGSRSGPRTAFVGRNLGLVGPTCRAPSLAAGIPLSYGGPIEDDPASRPRTPAGEVSGSRGVFWQCRTRTSHSAQRRVDVRWALGSPDRDDRDGRRGRDDGSRQRSAQIRIRRTGNAQGESGRWHNANKALPVPAICTRCAR